MSVVLVLAGCASGPDLKNPEVRQGIASVRSYEAAQLKGKTVTKLKTVEATICNSNIASGGSSTDEGAKTELRYLAYKAGGNGITNLMCQATGASFSSNCWKATVCYADAIRVLK